MDDLQRPSLLVLAAVIVFAAVGVLVSRPDLVPLPAREGCVATVGDQSVRVNLEQAEHASLIAAISIQRGLPARALAIITRSRQYVQFLIYGENKPWKDVRF